MIRSVLTATLLTAVAVAPLTVAPAASAAPRDGVICNYHAVRMAAVYEAPDSRSKLLTYLGEGELVRAYRAVNHGYRQSIWRSRGWIATNQLTQEHGCLA